MRQACVTGREGACLLRRVFRKLRSVGEGSFQRLLEDSGLSGQRR